MIKLMKNSVYHLNNEIWFSITKLKKLDNALVVAI